MFGSCLLGWFGGVDGFGHGDGVGIGRMGKGKKGRDPLGEEPAVGCVVV